MRKYRHEVPGPFIIILQILSGAFAGLLIAGVYLALKPVKTSPVAEGSTERNVVLYTPGDPGHPAGQQWRLRERAFLDRATAGVAMSETDINRWVQTTYGSQDRRVEFKSYDITIDPSLPLFRVHGEDVQVAVEFSCSMGKSKKSVVAHAIGRLEQRDGQHAFVPATVYLGSCPLPGPLGARLVSKLAAAYPVPENVTASWKAVTSAKVEEGRLKLAFN